MAVSYHPSAVLRAPDESAQRQLFQALVEDLVLVKEAAAGDRRASPGSRISG